MGNAVHKEELMTDTVQLDVRDALAAALLRADEVPSSSKILEMVSAEEWKEMDANGENVLVFDPD